MEFNRFAVAVTRRKKAAAPSCKGGGSHFMLRTE
jgi:hypothetical protein